MLEKGTLVYVCGDGNATGRDIQEAIMGLLEGRFCDEDPECRILKENRVRAVAHVDQMKTVGWSVG